MSYWPWSLDYWKSGEWQVCQERLKDLDKRQVQWNPPRKQLFNSLRRIKIEDVKVIIMGQDPYPKRSHATGIAFCVPDDTETLPPTLVTILNEYEADLGQAAPWDNPDLSVWLDRGVLLWNVIPTCTNADSLSHQWEEYWPLTWEILDKILAAQQPLVIACLGGYAASVLRPKDYDSFTVITVSHPSPRASKASNNPFTGSRLFTRINTALQSDWGLEPIDWSIGDGKTINSRRQTTAKAAATFSNETQEFFEGLSEKKGPKIYRIEE